MCEKLRCVNFIFELLDEGLYYKMPEIGQILADMAYWWTDNEGHKNPPKLRLRIAEKAAERPTSPIRMFLLGDYLGKDPDPRVSN